MTTLDILARTLWAEARSEGRIGMEAVASVILNRAAHPGWWGHDILTVCTKPYQFSCWLPTDPQYRAIRAVTAADPLFKLAQHVAADAIAGRIADHTGGADSYANVAVCGEPAWAVGHVPTARIGHHTFWKVLTAPPAALSDADTLNAAEYARDQG